MPPMANVSEPRVVAEILERVERTFQERGWSPDAHQHLVTGGLLPGLQEAPRPASGGDTDAGTVPMDTAVAAVAGVVAGMIGWEEQDERRHRRRLEAAARASAPGASLQGLPARSLVIAAARRVRGRLRGLTTGARR